MAYDIDTKNAKLVGYGYSALETLLLQIRNAGANGFIDNATEKSLETTILNAFDYRNAVERGEK